jgi:signal transduction histidine kinase
MLVCYVDADRCYRYNSVAYSRWFGRSPEQIHGQPLWEVLGDAAYERLRPYVDTALVGVPVHFEHMVPYWEAGTRTVRAHYLPDAGPDGRVRGFFALITDLTHEAEPTGQVPVGVRQDMLGTRERLATIGEMATEILHEMSQPLTSIGLYSETGVRLLRAGAEGAVPALEVLEEVRRQSDRARGMLERLRRFVRSGRASEAPVEINHLVRTAVRLTAAETEARGAVLELRLRSGLCIVSAERLLLEHLILNLIRNALSALDGLPPGHRRLALRTVRGGRRVRITIADSRPVSPGGQDLVPFDPAAQAAPDPGALRLALGRAIAHAHGGTLRVRHSPRVGAVMQVILPAACEE